MIKKTGCLFGGFMWRDIYINHCEINIVNAFFMRMSKIRSITELKIQEQRLQM